MFRLALITMKVWGHSILINLMIKSDPIIKKNPHRNLIDALGTMPHH